MNVNGADHGGSGSGSTPDCSTKLNKDEFDVVGYIIEYEQNALSADGIKRLFQHLVDTGMAWKLQGHYGRTAKAMIEAGLIRPKGGS